ncbi:MAG: hypothetical protein CVU18_08460 [Betaproteobacteria bacterium HGW-Betaproteobacteria-12]|nr:MAG: hypothetical protein CVU18_08460 [Betaproteobacteria bacterium HGW-Betaproteobacteria-12]
MKLPIVLASVLMMLVSPAAAPASLAPADAAAAFKAAGFKLQGKRWRACDDPTPTYEPGAIADVRDLNGDGRPEALITEGGSFCYGNTGYGYSLVSKQADGRWQLITNGTGILSFLSTRGAGGWPDIEIGGPGFCFPVARWDGRKYALHRHQYNGKPCRRP